MKKTTKKQTSLQLGPEWELCARLAPLTAMESKTALLRRTVQDHVVETALNYAKPGKQEEIEKCANNE